MKKFKPSSRQSQKLAYALLGDYANYLASKSPESLPHEYWIWKAKSYLKKLYIQATRELREGKAFDIFKSNVSDSLIEALERDWTNETKANVILDDIEANLREFLEWLSIELNVTESFSLALRVCSQEKMCLFIKFIIDFYLDNDIPINDKTHEMILEQEGANFTIACLKNRKCVITGKEGADIHHIESYTSRKYKPEYAKDLLVIPVCREMHNLCHNKGNRYVLEKYNIVPVPEKLALGAYTQDEINKEIKEHINPKTNSDYKGE